MELHDSTYLVTEDVENIGKSEYFVNIDIGACSCSRSCNRATCEHKAAVAKAFSICSDNLVPYYSKEDVCSSGNRRRGYGYKLLCRLAKPKLQYTSRSN